MMSHAKEQRTELQEMLDLGEDATDLVKMLMGMGLVPEGVILTDWTEGESYNIPLIDAGNRNEDPDCSLECPVTAAFVDGLAIAKMSVNGVRAKQVTKILIGQDDDPGLVDRAKAFFQGREVG